MTAAVAALIDDHRRTHSDGDEPWRSLFNLRAYHRLNMKPGQEFLAFTAHDDAGQALGGVSAVRDGSTLVSGYSAPFGGVDLVRPRETPDRVAAVVQSVLRRTRDLGVERLRIRLAPACYGESHPLLLFTLLNHGFVVERCELNQHIDLSGMHGVEDWAGRLHRPARRALHTLLEGDFTFRVCETDAERDRAYEVLAANRARKGRALSISRAYVHGARSALPGRIELCELHHGDAPVAASLNYDVAPGCRLVVAWGDAAHDLPKSPMVLLAYRLVEAAIADGVRVLDLGISNSPVPSIDTGLVPDLGLVQFKRSMLAAAGPRFTVVRSWAR